MLIVATPLIPINFKNVGESEEILNFTMLKIAIIILVIVSITILMIQNQQTILIIKVVVSKNGLKI